MEPDVVRTSDLYFASYLLSAGVKLLSPTKEGNKVVFTFSHPGVLIFKDLKSGYFSNTAQVSALSYAQSIRLLKNMVSGVMSGRLDSEVGNNVP